MAEQKPRRFKTAFETYTLVRQIGEGGAGTVLEVTASDGTHFALKVLDRAKAVGEKRKRFKNEIHFCSTERHRNIIHVLGSGITDDEAPFYVMPLYPTTLRKVIAAGIKPNTVVSIFDQLLSGLEAAHLLGVCHRDLKPENILHDPKSNTRSSSPAPSLAAHAPALNSSSCPLLLGLLSRFSRSGPSVSQMSVSIASRPSKHTSAAEKQRRYRERKKDLWAAAHESKG